MFRVDSVENGTAETLLDAFARTAAKSSANTQDLMVKAGESWRVPQNPRYVHFVRSGAVSHSICTQDGTTACVHVSTAGELVELHEVLTLPQLLCRATVMLPSHIARVPFRLVQQALAEDAHFHQELTQALGLRSVKAAQLSVCNAVHDLNARLARYLCTLASQFDGPLPVTQETLAAELAVQRTSVCLVMHELRQKQILDFSRGKITILNKDRLAACACECYALLAGVSLSRVQSPLHNTQWFAHNSRKRGDEISSETNLLQA